MSLRLQQCLPLAVLKPVHFPFKCVFSHAVATVSTACGIETFLRLGDHTRSPRMLQQHLPLAVCDEGCEAAEERSDDEGRTSLVPDRREGKTKVMK